MAYDKSNLELDSSIDASSIPARANIGAYVSRRPWGLRLFRSADISGVSYSPFQFVACIMNLIFSGNWLVKYSNSMDVQGERRLGQILFKRHVSKSISMLH